MNFWGAATEHRGGFLGSNKRTQWWNLGATTEHRGGIWEQQRGLTHTLSSGSKIYCHKIAIKNKPPKINRLKITLQVKSALGDPKQTKQKTLTRRTKTKQCVGFPAFVNEGEEEGGRGERGWKGGGGWLAFLSNRFQVYV